MSEKKGILKEKSFALALRCIKIYQYLSETKKEFVLSKQLLRSGTSVGANIREAQNAESKADFIHKLGIAQKECDEMSIKISELNYTQSDDNFYTNSIWQLKTIKKNTDETLYWLELLIESNFLNQSEFESIHGEAQDVLKMLRSSILTLKQKNS